MASVIVFSNNGLLISREKIRVHAGNSQSYGKSRSLTYSLPNSSYNSPSFHLLGFRIGSKVHYKLLCHSKINPMINENCKNKATPWGSRGNFGLRKRFSLRFRPRLRLLLMRLKRVSIWSMLNDIGIFLRKNAKRVTVSSSISVALGLCYLFLKLTAVPTPKVVPYSDLVTSLQNGTVTDFYLRRDRGLYITTPICGVLGELRYLKIKP
ncbi:hypothetical protein U1Q18_012140 [Sarracenia purpurea var. burkii]